jgi:hypothetical protein
VERGIVDPFPPSAKVGTMTTPAGEPHLDLVPEDGVTAPLPDGSLALPGLAAGSVDGDASLETERDKWRERAVIWRERALAAELIAQQQGAHLDDVKENLEDIRLAMRGLVDQKAVPAASRPLPQPAWKAYVVRLLDLDH